MTKPKTPKKRKPESGRIGEDKKCDDIIGALLQVPPKVRRKGELPKSQPRKT
jgi:hypothetical protein